MDKLRLIQCGVGGFGKGWITNHTSRSPDFELAAIVDISPQALHETGEAFSIPPERRFSSLEEAIPRVQADAVLTITPPAVHVLHAHIAFEHGLHLMTEKPLADTIENAQKMLQLAGKAGRQLLVSQQYRFRRPIQKLRELLLSGAVGEFGHGHLDFYIPADFTGTFREEMEYPLLLDMAIHHADLIRCVTGRDIVKATALSFRPSWSWYRHDPGLKMLLELEGGLPFSYSGDWSALGRSTSWNGSWRLQCSNGSLHLEDDKVLLARSARWGRENTIEEIALPPLEREEQSQTLHAFAEAIHTGTPAETCGVNNFNSFAAVVAAMESAREGRPVEISRVR